MRLLIETRSGALGFILKSMPRLFMLAVLLASSLTFAQTNKDQTVYFNGTPIKGTLVTIGGQQFVQLPLIQLQKSGALVSGGSASVNAIQGCVGQPLFNGVTRLTLLSAGVKDGRYIVSFKVANGTQKNLLPTADAGVTSDNLFAASDDGQVKQFDTWDDAYSPNQVITPGANLTANFVLHTPPSFKVTRVLFRPDEKDLKARRLSGLPFAPVSAMEFAVNCK